MSPEAFRIVIIIGVIISIFASRANKLVGGIIGCLVTTFILIFGLQAYAHSGYITIIGIPLSEGLFVLIILVWFGFDIKQIANGLKEQGIVKQIRAEAAEKLRSGLSVLDVMAQLLPQLANQPQDLKEIGGNILKGKPFAQALQEYRASSGKDEDQAVLRYQHAVDVLNGLKLIIMAQGAGLGLAGLAEPKSFFLPAVRLRSAKTFSLGKKLVKGELLYLYNGKWVKSPEELAAESSQTAPGSQVQIRSLFQMPNNPAWICRKLDIKGGPLELDSIANG